MDAAITSYVGHGLALLVGGLGASLGLATGDESRVLYLIGDLESRNGEMLTTALRDELRAAGFTHVEGLHAGHDWWARV